MAKYSKTIFFTSCLSLILSIYTEVTKRKLLNDKNYVPFCNFNEYSCSKIMLSEYSTGFGLNFIPDALKISNSLYGIIFYAIVASLSKNNNTLRKIELYTFINNSLILGFSKQIHVVEIQLFLSSLSIWMSIYLSYVLFYIIKDVCLVCILMHSLNAITIFFVIMKYLYSLKMKKTKTF